MAFDWWNADVPNTVRSTGTEKHRAMHIDEVRQRAGLLRRLGYEQSFAAWRCQRNLAWGFEMAGKAPLTDADVKKIVAEVFKR